MNTMDKTFDPQTLADDLMEVRRIQAWFFAGINQSDWDRPQKGGAQEWTLHETVAHQCALNGDGLESIRYALRGETYNFTGLDSRYEFNAWNRKGINRYRDLPMKELCEKLLGILQDAASIARSLTAEQAMTTAWMPIYNRPIRIIEALGIISFHTGLSHTAQVAEPAGKLPLWVQLSPKVRHRLIGRVMRAFSLLYRLDFGGSLRTTIAFHIDGSGGGDWHVDLSPEAPTSGEGAVYHPGLLIHMKNTDVFCKMLTNRLNLLLALISGDMKLSRDLRLFLRMGNFFSVDARPKAMVEAKTSSLPQHLMG